MHNKRLILSLLICLCIVLWYRHYDFRDQDPEPATGLRCDLEADGRCQVSLDRLLIASGQIKLFDASTWFQSNSPVTLPGEPIQSTLQRGILMQKYANYELECSIQRMQEDLHFEAKVHNRSEHVLSLWGIDGWEFVFPSSPRGYANDFRWTLDYLRANGLACMHPSYWYRLACSYQTTPKWGVGMSMNGLGMYRSLWYWHATPEYGALRRRLTLLVERPILPQQSVTVRWVWRISRQTDWKHLLTPYRDQHLQTFGPLRYHPDHRPVVQGLRCDPTHRSDDNPFGYVPKNPWRFDQMAGAISYGKIMADAARQGHCQGLIAWGWAYLKDDLWYPLDSNDLPALVQQNVELVRQAFSQQGLRCGALLRFGYMQRMRRDGKREPAVEVRFSSTSVDLLEPRFKQLNGLGYLDDAGLGDGDGSTRTPMDDVSNLAAMRQRLGPEPQWFLEHATDWSLPHAGFFTYITKTDHGYDPYPIGQWQYEVMRWLYPDAAIIGAMHGSMQQEELIRLCFERYRIAPVIQDWLLVENVPLLQHYAKLKAN